MKDIFNFELDEKNKKLFPHCDFVFRAEKENDGKYKITWIEDGELEQSYIEEKRMKYGLDEGYWVVKGD